jgi:hypothetical protein
MLYVVILQAPNVVFRHCTWSLSVAIYYYFTSFLGLSLFIRLSQSTFIPPSIYIKM